MNPFYEWLYDWYAEPRMDEALLHPVYQTQKQAWLTVTERLSPDDSLTAADYIESLKTNWGSLAFDRGVKVGFMLYASLVEGWEE